MGIFANTSSPLDVHIDRATSDKNTSEDWSVILDVCDRVKEYTDGPKDCIKALTKKLQSDNPRVALQAITLLDACVNNCGRSFLLEVASREFESELRKLLTAQRIHSKVSDKLRRCLKTWAEGEFKNDRQLSLIPALYTKLQQEGYDFSTSSDSPKKKKQEYSNDPNVVNNKQEEDDIAQAIQMSLQTANKSSPSNHGSHSSSSSRSLYPSDVSSDLARGLESGLTLSDSKGPASSTGGGAGAGGSSSQDAVKKARALYDFEAVEDNELTFQAGELIVVIDNSDPNWWKGSNHRGEGLFPANFVTLDIHGDQDHHPTRNEKRVSFSECVKVTELEGPDSASAGGDGTEGNSATSPAGGGEEEVTGEVDEEKIDYLLHLLHEADPTGVRPDDPQLPSIEEQVSAMAPTIDAELEQIDRRHNELTRLNAHLMTGLNLYHQLMREMPVTSMAPGYFPPSQYPNQPMPPSMDPAAGGHMMHHAPPQHQMPPGAYPYPAMHMMGGGGPHGPPMGPYPAMAMSPHHMGGLPPSSMAAMGPPPITSQAPGGMGSGPISSQAPGVMPQVSMAAMNGQTSLYHQPAPLQQPPLPTTAGASQPSQDGVNNSDSSNTYTTSSSSGGLPHTAVSSTGEGSALPSYGHYPPDPHSLYLQQQQPLHYQNMMAPPQQHQPPLYATLPHHHQMPPTSVQSIPFQQQLL